MTTVQYTLQKVAQLTGHTDRVWFCAWSPGGTALATCGSDKTIRVWKKKGRIAPYSHGDEIPTVLHQDDNQVYPLGSIYSQVTRDSALTSSLNTSLVEIPFDPVQAQVDPVLLSHNDWECIQVLTDVHDRSIRSLAWSPNGRHIAAASFDHSVSIWELIDGVFELTTTLRGHESEVKSVAWNSSGELLVTSSRDKTAWIWENDGNNNWECISVLTGHSGDIKRASFHPFSDDVITASYDDTLRIWEAQDDDWYNSITLNDATSTVWDFSFSQNAQFIATVSDDSVLRLYIYQPTSTNISSSSSSTTIIHKEWSLLAALQTTTRPLFVVSYSKPFYPPYLLTQDIPCDEPTAQQFIIYEIGSSFYLGLAPYFGLIATGAGDNNVHIFDTVRYISPELITLLQDDINHIQYPQLHIENRYVLPSKDISHFVPVVQRQKQQDNSQQNELKNNINTEDNQTAASQDLTPVQPEVTLEDVQTKDIQPQNIATTIDQLISPLSTQIDGLIYVYSQKNAHLSDVNCVTWNPKICNLLATAGDDNQVSIWRFATLEQ